MSTLTAVIFEYLENSYIYYYIYYYNNKNNNKKRNHAPWLALLAWLAWLTAWLAWLTGSHIGKTLFIVSTITKRRTRVYFTQQLWQGHLHLRFGGLIFEGGGVLIFRIFRHIILKFWLFLSIYT